MSKARTHEVVAVLEAALELRPATRPQAVRVAVLPEEPGGPRRVGPLAFVPTSNAAMIGVHVLAVERTPKGSLVAVVATAGAYPAVLSPGDVLAVLP